MSESRFKVTDKRMFTADGHLREEFRFLEEEPSQATGEVPSAAPAEAAAPSEPVLANAAASNAAPPEAASPEEPLTPSAESSGPETEGDEGVDGAPGFLDLVAMLAEPASIYLQRAQAARGADPESLHLAGLHLDLLDVLRRKSQGNLSARESSTLDNALSQLRTAYLQVRG